MLDKKVMSRRNQNETVLQKKMSELENGRLETKKGTAKKPKKKKKQQIPVTVNYSQKEVYSFYVVFATHSFQLSLSRMITTKDLKSKICSKIPKELNYAKENIDVSLVTRSLASPKLNEDLTVNRIIQIIQKEGGGDPMFEKKPMIELFVSKKKQKKKKTLKTVKEKEVELEKKEKPVVELHNENIKEDINQKTSNIEEKKSEATKKEEKEKKPQENTLKPTTKEEKKEEPLKKEPIVVEDIENNETFKFLKSFKNKRQCNRKIKDKQFNAFRKYQTALVENFETKKKKEKIRKENSAKLWSTRHLKHLNETESMISRITLNLNKLTKKNYDQILSDCVTDIIVEKDETIKTVISTFFDHVIQFHEEQYSDATSNLLTDLNNKKIFQINGDGGKKFENCLKIACQSIFYDALGNLLLHKNGEKMTESVLERAFSALQFIGSIYKNSTVVSGKIMYSLLLKLLLCAFGIIKDVKEKITNNHKKELEEKMNKKEIDGDSSSLLVLFARLFCIVGKKLQLEERDRMMYFFNISKDFLSFTKIPIVAKCLIHDLVDLRLKLNWKKRDLEREFKENLPKFDDKNYPI